MESLRLAGMESLRLAGMESLRLAGMETRGGPRLATRDLCPYIVP